MLDYEKTVAASDSMETRGGDFTRAFPLKHNIKSERREHSAPFREALL